MCCDNEKDLQDPRRFGALAVLSGSPSGLEQDLSGQLVFFNKTHHESSVATHVRFIPTRDHPLDDDLTFTIFSTGDLTVPFAQCKKLEEFTVSEMESRLEQQLLLQVGGDGIIGRRITISSPSIPTPCVAEGIVGFNHGLIASGA